MRLLPNPLGRLRRIVEDDTAVLQALARGPKAPTDLALATSLDPARMYAAVDRLIDDGLVVGAWVPQPDGDTRWTFTATPKESP
jgi:DNA-binding PadR family transcriptional regulator